MLHSSRTLSREVAVVPSGEQEEEEISGKTVGEALVSVKMLCSRLDLGVLTQQTEHTLPEGPEAAQLCGCGAAQRKQHVPRAESFFGPQPEPIKMGECFPTLCVCVCV